jgi:hypothetical protein
MLSFRCMGIVVNRRRCSRGVFVLVILLLLTQVVPRPGRAFRSMAVDGFIHYGPVRRAISEVPNTLPHRVAAQVESRRRSDRCVRFEEGDQRASFKRSSDADRNLALTERVRCRELPRSHTCDSDGVIVRHA